MILSRFVALSVSLIQKASLFQIGNEETDEPTGCYAKHFAMLTEAMWRQDPSLQVMASGRWGRRKYWSRFNANPCLVSADAFLPVSALPISLT